MNINNIYGGEVAVATNASTTIASTLEFCGLKEHLVSCQNQKGFLLDLKIGAGQLHSFVLARFVTSITAVLLLAGAAYLLV